MKKILLMIALTASFLPLALNAALAGSGCKEKVEADEASKKSDEKR